MKIAVVVVRSLLGLLFVFASVAYLFKLIPQPPVEGNMLTFRQGLEASVYIMYVVKVTELVCGIAFVTGRFVPLATVLIAPITINIVGVHSFLAHEGLPVALFVLAANLLLAYHHRKSYEPLFAMK